MKNLLKIFFMASALCFFAILISCDEHGGTIIVKNNYQEDKAVTVYSSFSGGIVSTYKDKYGPINIIAGSTGIFSVKGDTSYGIVWKDGRYDTYKIIDVSGGETVEVTIP